MTKFLLNADFKVIRKGAMVEADESAGEFVYVTGNELGLSSAQLQEIAKANNIAVGSKAKKDELTTKIDEALMTDETIATQEQPTESQRVEEIVRAGYEANKKDDDIMIDIVTAGISFRKAGKLFKQATEKLGLRVSAKDRNEKVAEILAGLEFHPESEEDVKAAIKAVVDGVDDTDEKQALASIRRYAKQNGIELPKVEKVKGAKKGAAGGGGFRSKALQWIVDNPEATVEEYTAWIASNEKPEAIQKRFADIFKTAHALADAKVAA